MSVPFPAVPWLADVKPRLIRYGSDLTPPLGGPAARINRLGSRYSVAVSLPDLEESAAAAWIGARLAAEANNETLTLTWISASALAFNGNVNGAGQAGTSLAVNGLPPNANVPALSPFSFVANGRNYLHLTTAAVMAGALGTATLPLAPMLRAAPAAGTPVSFEAPTIEGFCDGTSVDWELQYQRWHKISFTLTENA